MKAYKISDVNVVWLDQFGENPNQAITKIREGNPKVTQLGYLGNLKVRTISKEGTQEGNLGNPNPSTVAENKSLAELKVKFNTILIKIKKDISTLQNNQNDIQERINKAVYIMVKRQTESLRDELIKLKQGDTKRH